MVFENLPYDLVREIASKLPCGPDHGSMAAVCPAWRDALKGAARHPFAPLLLFSNAAAPLDVHTLAPICSCFVCAGELKRITIPEYVLYRRFFGSFDDAWLLCAMGRLVHAAVNLRSGAIISLPDEMAFESGSYTFPVLIQAATLSGSPESDCVAGAIVERFLSDNVFERDLMFWSSGSLRGWGLQHQAIQSHTVEDMLCLNGRFYLLTSTEQIVAVYPQFGHNDWFLNANVQSLYFRTDNDYRPEFVHSRYLVESRGELLMVSRCRQDANNHWWYTSSFRVFRMEAVPETDGVFVWNQLQTFDGRMIFIARGCSRAYELTDFADWGCVEGVYFKGDVDVWSYDWEGLDAAIRRGMMDDQGVWLGSPFGPIRPCFSLPEQVANEMDFSPPVWIFPGNEAMMEETL